MHKFMMGFAKRGEVVRIVAWYCGKSLRVVDLFRRFLAVWGGTFCAMFGVEDAFYGDGDMAGRAWGSGFFANLLFLLCDFLFAFLQKFF